MRKKFLRVVACLMVVLMTLTAVPVGVLGDTALFSTKASAVKLGDSGKCGENVRYTLDKDGVLVISGTGEMYDYFLTGLYSPFCYDDFIISIVINQGVTSIGDGAFAGCKNLISVSIPNSVATIGCYTFEDCINLPSIVIPSGVVSIGEAAFWGCYNLSRIVISDGVKKIGDDAFEDCYNLTHIKIPKSVTNIGDYAFSDCKKLELIIVEDGNKNYSSQDGILFNENKTELKIYPIGKTDLEYTIPNKVTNIGDSAFSGCSSLTSVIIHDRVTDIESYAFFNCNRLKDVTIPNSVTYIGDYAFGYYEDEDPFGEYIKNSEFKINGFKGSEAEKYAINNGLEFIRLAHEHNYISKDTISPTCAKNGVRIFTCACGDSYTEKIPATGHKTVTDKAVAATCTKNGKTAGSHCSVCGTVIKAQTTVKATGHTYGAWKTTKKATYTATGTQTRVCTACGAKQTKTIAKLATTSVTKCTITTAKSAVYTGRAIAPKIAVKNGKTTLKSGTHYTVSYKNNTKIGKATVTIKGVEKSGYSGTKTLTFNILSGVTKSLKATQSTSAIKLAWSKVAGATGYRVYRHDGKKWVKLADTKNTTYTVSKLKAGTNYKYAVKAYTTVGKTVYWSASYAQISTATKPATPTVKVSAGKKQAALSWNKVTGASGYVVYYSTSKNGTYKKLATVKGTSYTAKKLATGKTYYFKVAAYKTVGKANIYGAYSTVKGVKVK